MSPRLLAFLKQIETGGRRGSWWLYVHGARNPYRPLQMLERWPEVCKFANPRWPGEEG